LPLNRNTIKNMTWQVKIVDEKQKILIISKNHLVFTSFLKKKLEDSGGEVFVSSHLPKNFESFDYCFLVNPSNILEENIFLKKKVFLIYINKKTERGKYPPIKTIFINGDKIDEQVMEKILWFFFSNTKEKHLLIKLPKIRRTKIKIIDSHRFFNLNFFLNFFNKKNVFILIFLSILLFNFIFVPPLLISGVFLYQTINNFKQEQLFKAKNDFLIAKNNFLLSKKLYSFSRPVYLIFSLASYPDDTMEIGEQIISILDHGFAVYNNSQGIFSSLFENNKSQQKKKCLACE